MKMKKMIVALLMLIPIQIVSGQDHIITIEHDTIHCRIITVSPTRIQYEQKAENGYMIGKSISGEQVLEYYQRPQSAEINPYFQTERRVPKPLHRWMVGLQTGVSFMTASTAVSEKDMINMGMTKIQAEDYYRQLKRGWHLHGDIHYMDSEDFGFGVKYSFFTSSAQQDFILKSYGDLLPTFVCVGIKERQYIQYAGPSVMLRQWLGKNRQLQLTETFSMGYVHYRDELRTDATFNLDNALIEGNTWGATGGISLDYFPVSWLSVGMNAGFMYARLTKMTISTKDMTQSGELDQKYYRYLSRIDCSLGIRFHF